MQTDLLEGLYAKLETGDPDLHTLLLYRKMKDDFSLSGSFPPSLLFRASLYLSFYRINDIEEGFLEYVNTMFILFNSMISEGKRLVSKIENTPDDDLETLTNDYNILMELQETSKQYEKDLMRTVEGIFNA